MPAETFRISADAGHEIGGSLWRGTSTPKAIIQIFHGLGEHRDRYERFAQHAIASGYVVACHDHRGHGANARVAGYFADSDGWDHVVADGLRVTEYLKSQFPGTAVVLLGHSMGSYIAQAFTMRHSRHIKALVLSASTWPQKGKLIPGRLLARLEAMRIGATGRSALLDKLGFGDFNKPFEPGRTELDWLSRDPDEVDKYIADPLCGGPYTCSLWIDLMTGLLGIASETALRNIPAELPILLTGGTDDPVGGEKGITELDKRYRSSGHSNVTLQLYRGGRHEMFNETNRDAFSTDVLSWIDDSYQA